MLRQKENFKIQISQMFSLDSSPWLNQIPRSISSSPRLESDFKVSNTFILYIKCTNIQILLKIIKEVGKGGFGVVYKAKHNIDNGIYAIKQILLKSFERETILREVNLAQKFEHPNIVR